MLHSLVNPAVTRTPDEQLAWLLSQFPAAHVERVPTLVERDADLLLAHGHIVPAALASLDVQDRMICYLECVVELASCHGISPRLFAAHLDQFEGSAAALDEWATARNQAQHRFCCAPPLPPPIGEPANATRSMAGLKVDAVAAEFEWPPFWTEPLSMGGAPDGHEWVLERILVPDAVADAFEFKAPAHQGAAAVSASDNVPHEVAAYALGAERAGDPAGPFTALPCYIGTASAPGLRQPLPVGAPVRDGDRLGVVARRRADTLAKVALNLAFILRPAYTGG